MFAKMAYAFIDSLNNIIKTDDQVLYWKILFEQHKYLASNLGIKVDARNEHRTTALSIAEKICERDPSFTYDDIEVASSGCYVATCVYGSYDCPEVWTLRRYRDYTLDTTWYGRAFIKVYYAISPTIVEWFGETAWFKKLWKGKLDKMVAELQKQGYESTKYNDKY